MLIRKATLEDTEHLQPLFAGSLQNMARLQPRQYREAEQDTDFIQAGIVQENGDVLVLETEGKIVGLASVFVEQVSPLPFRVHQSYCELDTLYVLEGYRNRGFGMALLEAARGWAKEHGCASLQLMTLGENTEAQRFYERAGMRPHKIIYIQEEL